MNNTFNVPHWITGIALFVFGGLVILGGIKSIGRVTAFFVPIMALFYFIAGTIIMVMNSILFPGLLLLFSVMRLLEKAAVVVQSELLSVLGLLRSVLERSRTWLGSYAAAAAKTDMPGRQALISMTQVL